MWFVGVVMVVGGGRGNLAQVDKSLDAVPSPRAVCIRVMMWLLLFILAIGLSAIFHGQ